MDGDGCLRMEDGSVYVGMFVKGHYNGKGTLSYVDGSKYEG